MQIKSLKTGRVVFEGRYRTVKECLEAAASMNRDLSGINLRKANLRNAKLDGIRLSGSCLWGADLAGADIAGAMLDDVDLKASNLTETCLAETDMSNCNFHGARFSETILFDTKLDNTMFSTPGIFECDLAGVRSMKGASYCHKGVTECQMSKKPMVVEYKKDRMVILDRHIIFNNYNDVIEKSKIRLLSLVNNIETLIGEKNFTKELTIY